MTIPDELAERVARAMCEEMGLDPDEKAPGFVLGRHFLVWEHLRVDARKFIAFQRAWDRVKE
jgi:hypothetical protein